MREEGGGRMVVSVGGKRERFGSNISFGAMDLVVGDIDEDNKKIRQERKWKGGKKHRLTRLDSTSSFLGLYRAKRIARYLQLVNFQ